MDLCVDTQNRVAVVSFTNPTQRAMPAFYVCETVKFQLIYAKPTGDPSGGDYAPWDYAESNTWQPVVSIGSGGTILGDCTNWSYDAETHIFTGNLSLDTPAARAYIAANGTVQAILEVQHIEPGVGMIMDCQTRATVGPIVYPPGTQPSVPMANGGILIPDMDAGGYKLLCWKDGSLTVLDLPQS